MFSLIANFILLLPAVIFIGGFVNSYISIALLLLYAYWAWLQINEFLKSHKPFSQLTKSIDYYLPELSIAAFMAFIWVLPSGAGGIGYIQHDSNMSNTTFSLLVNQDWPIWFTPEYLGEKFTYHEPRPFVYYFGHYLPAAVIGKLFGWRIGELSLFLWTGLCIFVLFMLLLMHIKRQNKQVKWISYSLFLILFCLYGGLDWWASAFLKVTLDRSEIWSMPFVFLSNTRLLYWSPHNTLSVWLLMCLLIQGTKEPWQAKLFGPTVVSVLICSPIGLIGVMPFILLFVLLNPREQLVYFFNGWSILLSVATLIILVAFITSNSFNFPVEWLPGAAWLPDFTQRYTLFLMIELLAATGVFLLTYKNSSFRETCFIVLAYVLLLIIPFLRIGLWNDWCAKTSVASLFVISFMASKNIIVKRLPLWQSTLAVLLMLVSGFTAGEELIVATKEFKNNVSVVPNEFRTYGQWYATEQRIGKADSFFYHFLAKENHPDVKKNREF